MPKNFLFAPALAVMLATSVNAQEQSVSVSYADLDLTTGEGIERLDLRIGAAVRQVCDTAPQHQDLRASLASRNCAREATADVASPRQYAIDRARGKQPSVRFATAGATSRPIVLVRKR